jgi:citrate synthase
MGRDTLSVTDNRTGKTYELPIENGAIRAKDLRQIRVDDEDYGLKGYDPAFLNTAACKSRITYIDGEKGILRYRGYPIEQLAEKSNYLEVANLILYGELPAKKQYDEWVHNITHHTILHEYVKKLLDGFRYDAHPMGMLIGGGSALHFYPTEKVLDRHERLQTYRLIAMMLPSPRSPTGTASACATPIRTTTSPTPATS